MSKQAQKYKDKGNEEFRKGNHGKAIEFYTYATEIDPKNPIYFSNRATAYGKMGKWDKSLRDSLKATKLDAQWPKGWWRAGTACMALERYEEAVNYFKTACDISSTNETFQNSLREAKKKFMKDFSEAQLLKTEGNELFKKGNVEEALKKYTQAIGAAETKETEVLAAVYANRAMCYQQLYDPKKVVSDCTNCLKLVPTHVKALIRRAQALEGLEKWEEALKDFETALLFSPSSDVAIMGASRIRNALRRKNAK